MWFVWKNCAEFGFFKYTESELDKRIMDAIHNCQDVDYALVEFPDDYFERFTLDKFNLDESIINTIQAAINATKTQAEAARLLGISPRGLCYYLDKKYPNQLRRKR